jgi:hypothetical protein
VSHDLNRELKTPPMRIVHILIGKSIFETLLLVSLVVVFFLDAFPQFHGWGEVTPQGISGWVVNNSAPWDRVEVQLFVNGKFAGRAVANESRIDVVRAGWSEDEWHGYTFPISTDQTGIHEARVYALHDSGQGKRKTLQLVGDPLRFTLSHDGTITSLDANLKHSTIAFQVNKVD